MSQETLRYIRNDTTQRFGGGRRVRGDVMGAMVVNLDGGPDPFLVKAVLLGVACDRGVGLGNGRIGSADGPQRFRDIFWRMTAPEGWQTGAILDAGDLVSAGRTDETHARLTEVLTVLRGRFPAARVAVVGGGHDALYGEVLGLSRWLRKAHDDARIGLCSIDAAPDAATFDGEPHDHTALRRLIREPAARVGGEDVILWGLQRPSSPASQLAFLRGAGCELSFCPEGDEAGLLTSLRALAARVHGLSLAVDLGAFPQSVAPGVSEPMPIGVRPEAVIEAAVTLAALPLPSSLSIWGLNPRFDRDAATARLAARLVYSYMTGAR